MLGGAGIPADMRERLVRYYPESVIAYAEAHGIAVRPLAAGEGYCAASPELRRLGVDVDAWPVAPAGLFVVTERTIYLREVASDMALVHEFAHGLDCALGGGVYFTGVDQRVREAFRDARAFVTAYAASGVDEYFAESVRAYVGANDERSPWPKVSRERLAQVDPVMSALVAQVFASIPQGDDEARCFHCGRATKARNLRNGLCRARVSCAKRGALKGGHDA
jgi:hypothetical protein